VEVLLLYAEKHIMDIQITIWKYSLKKITIENGQYSQNEKGIKHEASI